MVLGWGWHERSRIWKIDVKLWTLFSEDHCHQICGWTDRDLGLIYSFIIWLLVLINSGSRLPTKVQYQRQHANFPRIEKLDMRLSGLKLEQSRENWMACSPTKWFLNGFFMNNGLGMAYLGMMLKNYDPSQLGLSI